MTHREPLNGLQDARTEEEFERAFKEASDTTWAQEFDRQENSWVNEFHEASKETWAEEFSKIQNEVDISGDSKEALAKTAGLLLDVVEKSANPKFKSSKFLSFMKQIRDQELSIEGNKVVENIKPVTGPDSALDWAKEFNGGVTTQSWEEEFNLETRQQPDLVREFLRNQNGTSDWAQEFRLSENAGMSRETEDLEDAYNAHFHAQVRNEEARVQEWETDWANFQPSSVPYSYNFIQNNPFLSKSTEALQKVAAEGNLAESILALEALVQKDSKNAGAWQSLGFRQQENENESQAIAALRNSVIENPTLVDSWTGLAVSYTNEGLLTDAYDALESWLRNNSQYSHLLEKADRSIPDRHEFLTGVFVEAARQNAGHDLDPAVQLALGVLFNICKEYDKAIDCFEASLSKLPQDYMLWNKLGATLANSSSHEKALDAYYNALQINPAYIRGRFNLAVSCIQLGTYKEAAEHILAALSIQEGNASGALQGEGGSLSQMDVLKHSALFSGSLWQTLRTVLEIHLVKDIYRRILLNYEQNKVFKKPIEAIMKRSMDAMEEDDGTHMHSSMDPSKRPRVDYPLQSGYPQMSRGQYMPDRYLYGGSHNRLLLALQSGLANEVDWAFNKLVKLSYTCPPQFHIGQIATLLDSIVAYAEPFFSSLKLNTALDNFETTIDDDSWTTRKDGKANILPVFYDFSVFNTKPRAELMERVMQVMHVLRNFSFMEHHQRFFISQHSILTILAKAIALPSYTWYIEVKQYSLEIFENLAGWLQLRGKNDFYLACLKKMLMESNREIVLGALRSLSKLCSNELNHPCLTDIDTEAFSKLFSLLYVKDEELVYAILEMIYTHSCLSADVALKIASAAPTNIVRLLASLLRPQHGEADKGVSSIPRGVAGQVPTAKPSALDRNQELHALTALRKFAPGAAIQQTEIKGLRRKGANVNGGHAGDKRTSKLEKGASEDEEDSNVEAEEVVAEGEVVVPVKPLMPNPPDSGRQPEKIPIAIRPDPSTPIAPYPFANPVFGGMPMPGGAQVPPSMPQMPLPYFMQSPLPPMPPQPPAPRRRGRPPKQRPPDPRFGQMQTFMATPPNLQHMQQFYNQQLQLQQHAEHERKLKELERAAQTPLVPDHSKVEPENKEETLYACYWKDEQDCAAIFTSEKDLLKHVLDSHVSDSHVSSSTDPSKCCWKHCQQTFSDPRALQKLSGHVHIHIGSSLNDNPDTIAGVPSVEEQKDLVGIPLTTLLILRNFARSPRNRELFVAYEKDLVEAAALNPKFSPKKKSQKKWEPPLPTRVGKKKKKGPDAATKLPPVFPTTRCKLKLLKNERIKDYLLMEEEFVQNQERLKPQEEKNQVERSRVDELRGSPMNVGTLEEIIDDDHAIVSASSGSEYYVSIMSYVDKDLLEPSCSVLLHHKNLCVVGVLQDDADPMVSVMKLEKAPTESYADEAVELPLTHPELYEEMGIKPPKGVILYGPPGTGKTLLAKAVANQTSATFLRVVGSELIQKYLGDGPKLVRELFRVAEENAPSIVFIDEIDAVGTKRYDSTSGGEREIQRTMLELLNQLDGFDTRGDVKVIMATNRIDSLDPALIRPGRIDRKIEFPLPDMKTKRRIFNIHTSRMTLGEDVDLEEFVMSKDDLSGADVKAICTEAGLLALRERRMKVVGDDFKKAKEKVLYRKNEGTPEGLYL
ncbi:ATPase of 26S proteasome regulatory subunit 4 [Phlyctochytrium bullatum]|nr:ATPase of 26S proteasome regulatory subunit 4 [Phlyctochytrium bullatum]